MKIHTFSAAILAVAAAMSGYRYGAGHWPNVSRPSAEHTSTSAGTSSSVSVSDRKIKFYRNPMGLPDISPVPKKDSMGMDYVPVYEGEETNDNTIKVASGKIQRTGVETAVVGRHPISRTVKAPGVIQLDENRIAVVAPRFDGFVEKVAPPTSGTHVKKGELLAEVFGQEILDQGARLLIERASGDDRAGSPAISASDSGVVGAKRRLLNLGVPPDFIDQIRETRRVPNTLPLRSPIDGVILERNIVDGQGFKAGDTAFRIADHSVVWMMADVAESDIGTVKNGQAVSVRTRAHPGREFNGTVAVVYPHLMKETRTARVRIELPNADLALLPDMYGDVEIATGANEPVIALPSSSVIDSGSRQVAFADLGDGRFEPREVKLGRKGDGYVEVLSGVAEGEKIVVNGTFLIDAESNLQSALKTFSAPKSEASP